MEEPMHGAKERGEGKFGLIVGIVVLALGAFFLMNVVPVYFADWELGDRMETAALGVPNHSGDKVSQEKVWEAVQELELTPYLDKDGIRVALAGGKRRITLSYQREVTYLPGYKKMVTFEHDVSVPVF
jgi:hypothetical protein